jgi:hypothetical protein
VEPTTSEKQQRGEHPVVIDGHPGAGHEFFDLTQGGFFRRRTEEHGVIGAGKFHQPGVGDMSGEIPSVRDWNPAVLHGV